MAKMIDRREEDRPREKMAKYGPARLSDYELTFEDLMSVKGMGIAKTTEFMAAFELWRRQFEVTERPIIDSPEKASPYLPTSVIKSRNILSASPSTALIA